MSRSLNGLLVLAVLSTSLTAFGEDDPPPPPPPPPPPLEESAPADTTSSEGWAIKGTNGLLDKSTGHVRKSMLSFFIGVPFSYAYTGFGVNIGGRFYIPIVKDGFLPMLNDSFGIEFGVDAGLVFGCGTGGALQIPAEARWNFHIFPRLEAYAKVGLGVGFYFGNNCFTGLGGFAAYFVPVANVGVLFKLTDSISLRAELGYPAVKVGIGFAF